MQRIHSLMYVMLFMIIHTLQAQTINPTIEQTIDALINQTLPYANVGVVIQDAESGRLIYSRQANKLFSPASNVKLFTAAAALYQLGEHYRYRTTLSQDRDNTYLTFSGSPSLTTAQLQALLATLKKRGITTIPGNIILDTSQFSPPNYADGISYDDMGWYYAAPSSAVIINENAANYDFISSKAPGLPIQIVPQLNNNGLTIINNVVTMTKPGEKCGLHIENKAGNALHIYGCLPQTAQPKRMQLAVPDPILLAHQLIQQIIHDDGIVLKGHIVQGKTPAHATLLAVQESHELPKLIAHMLEDSDNLYADSLTKLLAYTLTGHGTYQQGAFAIKQILAKHTTLNMTQVNLVDGNGTRYNLITPQQIVNLLNTIYHDEQLRTIFIPALPRMGMTGTLKDRMKKTALLDRIQAKTGTMHDVSALSGYLTTATGKPLIFSIISNNVTGPISKAKMLEEKILAAVFAL